jgi:hypothetical protein
MRLLVAVAAMAMFYGCSTASESTVSSTSLYPVKIPDLGAYSVRFDGKNRCLTMPMGSDISGRYVTGSNPYQHAPCSSEGQAFLFKKDDIREAGALGAYLTEVSGKVLASTSSPWTVLKSKTGAMVIQSQQSRQCLVADRSSDVVLGYCDDANAAVSLILIPVAAATRSGPIVACSTDNQGNAVDCI